MKSMHESHKMRSNGVARALFTGRSTASLAIRSDLYPQYQFSKAYQVGKRSLDICGALVGLLILILLLPLIALCIYMDDHGPIFYKQVRIGQYGRSFTLYKFRSMVQDADNMLACQEALRCAWLRAGKLRHDPRVTRVGKFLRRSSLDELPQMLNVLRGEMSLVGPRAIQSAELVIFDEMSQFRQLVKPGVTGLWQISGRSHIDYTQRRMLDCLYVLECSLSVDLAILIRTLPAILDGTGAY